MKRSTLAITLAGIFTSLGLSGCDGSGNAVFRGCTGPAGHAHMDREDYVTTSVAGLVEVPINLKNSFTLVHKARDGKVTKYAIDSRAPFMPGEILLGESALARVCERGNPEDSRWTLKPAANNLK